MKELDDMIFEKSPTSNQKNLLSNHKRAMSN
eukprot:CAMPEP_0179435196 /NCGR_PEP_ID=MMETSP0799-20121207/19360_1 /TAXON_ID=46947 /ORGANISM="Geminigera cryophila, Strain CCMP2564" /LENGTH=30 /DNA_ID= /DNA_START= /DNA_END= /DNA_ORIENTATION=